VLLSQRFIRFDRQFQEKTAMATTGLNPTTASSDARIEAKLRAEQVVKAAASWFLVVAGLSIVNSIVTLSGGSFHFIFGLGITQIVDAMGKLSGSVGSALSLVVNLFVAGVFALFWHFARQGKKWAFLTGMALYALDGLILLPFSDWLGAAFHAYALFRMYQGLQGLSALQGIHRSLPSSPAPIEPA